MRFSRIVARLAVLALGAAVLIFGYQQRKLHRARAFDRDLNVSVPPHLSLKPEWRKLRGELRRRPYSQSAAADAAMFLHAAGQSEAALLCYRWLRDLNSSDIRWLYYPAVLKMQASDFSAARELLQAGLRQYPKNSTLLSRYAFVLAHSGDPAAESAFKNLLEIDPLRAATYTEYGFFLNRSGRPQEAARQFEMALALDPSDGRAAVPLASFRQQAGSGRESPSRTPISSEPLAAGFTPSDPDPYLDQLYWRFPNGAYVQARSSYEASRRRFGEGLKWLRHARVLLPDHDGVLVDLVYFETRVNGAEAGRSVLALASRNEFAASTAFSNYALALSELGAWPQACDAFQAAVRRDANNPEALNGLGICEEKAGHPNAAEALYRSAIRLKPLAPAAANLRRLTGAAAGASRDQFASLRRATR